MDPETTLNNYQFKITPSHYDDKLSGITVEAITPSGDHAGYLHAPVANDEEAADFDVYVEPEHRGQGLGSQLWRTLASSQPVMNFEHGPFTSEEGRSLAHKMVRENPRQHHLDEEYDFVDPELNY